MNEIGRAVELLRAGELVAIPTETVYGLGADAANPVAVARIFAAKGRPADHPLIVHIPAASHLDQWAKNIPQAAHTLAATFWPGPLTLILQRQPTVPDAVTGGQNTVGLRVPGHPLALALLAAFAAAGGSGGIAAPSANRFGRISPTTADHVREELGDQVALILDGGPCEVGIESTIVDLSRGAPVILRPGAITAEQIAAALHGTPAIGQATASTPRVPGALEAHYAPETGLRLVTAAELPATVEALLAQDLRLAVLALNAAPAGLPPLAWIAAGSNARDYAHQLYAALRELDHVGADLILVEAPPQTMEWQAVHDRLGRAASGAGKRQADPFRP
ncbi:L-threonylcarbamoyladenylate synthase [Denitratisoma oestradiolicum]|uniref:Threonylcarbamoyl-AMP synthase n=1 Tax=Denitratisoma oestradiolicum TaxID=311182 RepID=A0A6S6XVM9_9PROT|nr:L-threonylcarbamoyladenylate synthase [Denitratisoma oestradiolicum]CAB1368273.1 Threonylcarbamoyl-AMP synthase [Denitratisoma oestradiolicum]